MSHKTNMPVTFYSNFVKSFLILYYNLFMSFNKNLYINCVILKLFLLSVFLVFFSFLFC